MTRIREAGVRPQAEARAARSRYSRFLMLAAAIAVALLALGYLPTKRLAGSEGVPAMFAGSGVSLVGSVAGTVPLLLSRGRTAVEIMPVLLGSIAVRMAAVVVLAVAVAWSGTFAIRPLVAWVAISHAGLLIADTLYAHGEVRSRSQAIKTGDGS